MAQRKKKPAAAADAAAPLDGQPEPAAADPETGAASGADAVRAPRKRAPKIHVPESGAPAAPGNGDGVGGDAVAVAPAVDGELASADGDEAPKPKKKTRRGSRGGRNRRKKTATGAAAAPAGGSGAPSAAGEPGEVDDTAAVSDAEQASPVEELVDELDETRRRARPARTTRATCPCPSGSTTSAAKPDAATLRRLAGACPRFLCPETAMSYAIISLGGKQYRVQVGERLLVDRVATEEGKTFNPPVLLVGGDGETKLSPSDVTVTLKVLGQQRGPKIRIGKYKQRTGYKRHTGFRAALSEIEVESIGGSKARAAKPKPEAAAPATPAGAPGLPAGYEELTVAQVKEAAAAWDAAEIAAALEFERAHAGRKGAVAALESAQKGKES